MDIIILYIVLKLPDLWNIWMFSPANIKGGKVICGHTRDRGPDRHENSQNSCKNIDWKQEIVMGKDIISFL